MNIVKGVFFFFKLRCRCTKTTRDNEVTWIIKATETVLDLKEWWEAVVTGSGDERLLQG